MIEEMTFVFSTFVDQINKTIIAQLNQHDEMSQRRNIAIRSSLQFIKTIKDKIIQNGNIYDSIVQMQMMVVIWMFFIVFSENRMSAEAIEPSTFIESIQYLHGITNKAYRKNENDIHLDEYWEELYEYEKLSIANLGKVALQINTFMKQDRSSSFLQSLQMVIKDIDILFHSKYDGVNDLSNSYVILFKKIQDQAQNLLKLLSNQQNEKYQKFNDFLLMILGDQPTIDKRCTMWYQKLLMNFLFKEKRSTAFELSQHLELILKSEIELTEYDLILFQIIRNEPYDALQSCSSFPMWFTYHLNDILLELGIIDNFISDEEGLNLREENLLRYIEYLFEREIPFNIISFYLNVLPMENRNCEFLKKILFSYYYRGLLKEETLLHYLSSSSSFQYYLQEFYRMKGNKERQQQHYIRALDWFNQCTDKQYLNDLINLIQKNAVQQFQNNPTRLSISEFVEIGKQLNTDIIQTNPKLKFIHKFAFFIQALDKNDYLTGEAYIKDFIIQKECIASELIFMIFSFSIPIFKNPKHQLTEDDLINFQDCLLDLETNPFYYHLTTIHSKKLESINEAIMEASISCARRC